MNVVDASKTFDLYSPIRQVGKVYFISGHLGADPKTRKVANDVGEKKIATINALEAIAVSNGY